MEATMGIEELLHDGARTRVGRALPRGAAGATTVRSVALYERLVDAAVAHDLRALRAIAAALSQVGAGTGLEIPPMAAYPFVE